MHDAYADSDNYYFKRIKEKYSSFEFSWCFSSKKKEWTVNKTAHSSYSFLSRSYTFKLLYHQALVLQKMRPDYQVHDIPWRYVSLW